MNRDSFLVSFVLDCVFPILAMLFAIIVFISVIAGLVDSQECRAKTAAMGLNAEWGIFTGCMVRINDQFLPYSEVVPVERDGKIVFVPKPAIRLQSIEK